MALPTRCVDLNEDHIDQALKSIESMRILLEHLARIAKPSQGAAKILVAISRIATTSCEWLEGKLHVEVVEVSGATKIEVSSDLGGGLRELIFPRLFVGVEHEELVNAVKVAPQLITPLTYRVRGSRLILKCDAPGSVAPPAFEIAEESLRRSLPPKLRRSLPPIPKEEPPADGVVLGQFFPKAQRSLMIDAPTDLDVGWDVSAYSSTLNTRETKPPPSAKTPSKLPTRAPPPPSDPPPARKPSRTPPKRPSKRPSKPAKPVTRPPAVGDRKRPVLRKVGDTKPKG